MQSLSGRVLPRSAQREAPGRRAGDLGRPQGLPAEAAEVLARVRLLRGVEVGFPPLGVRARPPAGVHGRRRLDDGVPPAEQAGAVGPVGLLGVEEEPLVEGAHVLQCLGPEHEDRPDDELRRRGAQPAEAECLAPRPSGGREGPADAGRLPVSVDLRGGDAGQPGVAAEHPVELGDVGGADDGVGVEQQHVGTGPEPVGEGQVDARGEAEVAAGVEVAHRPLGADAADLRGGRVVDDRARQPVEGRQGLPQVVRRAVGDDDDLEVRWSRTRPGERRARRGRRSAGRRRPSRTSGPSRTRRPSGARPAGRR